MWASASEDVWLSERLAKRREPNRRMAQLRSVADSPADVPYSVVEIGLTGSVRLRCGHRKVGTYPVGAVDAGWMIDITRPQPGWRCYTTADRSITERPVEVNFLGVKGVVVGAARVVGALYVCINGHRVPQFVGHDTIERHT